MRILFAVFALIFSASLSGAAVAADVSTKDTFSTQPLKVTVTSDKNPFAGAYFGVELGGQFTALRYEGHDVAAGDGLTYGGFGGYNFSAGRLVFGPYVRGGFANVDIAKVIEMQNYVQVGGLIGVQLGKESLLSARLGYEWQAWEAFNTDIDASGLVIAGGLETLLAPQTSIGINVDYIMLGDNVEIQGIGDVSRYLKDSDAFRITVGLTYRPEVTLPALF